MSNAVTVPADKLAELQREAAPAPTDDEVEAALQRCHLHVTEVSMQDMRRALTGFVTDRTAGVMAVDPPKENDRA